MTAPIVKLPAAGRRQPELPSRFATAPLSGGDSLASLVRAAVPEAGPLSEAGAHHFRRMGKMFRGRLALAVGAALEAPSAHVAQLATACELLHNASLLHDDVQDGDVMRRGQTAVWHEFGIDVAINLGDYLLVRAIDLANECQVPSIVSDFTRATLTVIRGQSIEMREKGSVDELTRYEEIAKAKTGPLLALPAVAVGRLGGLPETCLDTMRRALEDVGVAYQLQDDIVDLFGLKGRGAPGQDLREGKRTGPMLLDDPRDETTTGGALDHAARARRIAAGVGTRRTQQRIRVLVERSRSRVASLPPAIADAMLAAFEVMTDAARRIEASEPPEESHGQRARSSAG